MPKDNADKWLPWTLYRWNLMKLNLVAEILIYIECIGKLSEFVNQLRFNWNRKPFIRMIEVNYYLSDNNLKLYIYSLIFN